MDSLLRVYYLSGDKYTSRPSAFSASFAEIARVKDCYILADCLKDAVDILYSELPKVSSLTISDIDNALLSINFIKRLDVWE